MFPTLGLYRPEWPSQSPNPKATPLDRHIHKATDVTTMYIDLIIILQYTK